MQKTDLQVLGMTDNACRERLVEVLEGLEGVKDVQVNLHRGVARVLHEAWCDPEGLIAAILAAGFIALQSY